VGGTAEAGVTGAGTSIGLGVLGATGGAKRARAEGADESTTGAGLVAEGVASAARAAAEGDEMAAISRTLKAGKPSKEKYNARRSMATAMAEARVGHEADAVGGATAAAAGTATTTATDVMEVGREATVTTAADGMEVEPWSDTGAGGAADTTAADGMAEDTGAMDWTGAETGAVYETGETDAGGAAGTTATATDAMEVEGAATAEAGATRETDVASVMEVVTTDAANTAPQQIVQVNAQRRRPRKPRQRSVKNHGGRR
jgi:hypothetical protein